MKRILSTYAYLSLAACFIAAATAAFFQLSRPGLCQALFVISWLLIYQHGRRQLAKLAPAPMVEMSAGLPDSVPYVSPFNPVESRVFRCVECCAPSGEPHAANCSQAAAEQLEHAAAAIADLLPVASQSARSVAIDTIRLDRIERARASIKFFGARVYVGGAYGDTLREAIDKWIAARAPAGPGKGPAV